MKKHRFKKNIFSLIFLFLLFTITGNLFNILPLFSQENYPNLKGKNRIKKCPNNLEFLGNKLVQDIPSYANRVIQKSRKSSQEIQTIPLYIIIASKPEFEPISLTQNQYQTNTNEEVKQIFFTTLERQYLRENKVIETQNYHWLLLTETSQGWRMIMILSRFGSSNPNQISSPPKNTTNGIMGQAVKLWFRDCAAYFKE